MSLTSTSCSPLKMPSLPSGYSSSGVFIPKIWNKDTITNRVNSGVTGIWTDGTEIYFSYAYDHYVLNREKGTWENKTWNIPKFYAGSIWSNGENIYHTNNEYGYHILNKVTGEWEEKTWNGFKDANGFNVWTDGENIYFNTSYNSCSYVFNKQTGEWEEKNWNISLDGNDVWTDGTNIYYSSTTSQYVLHGDTWEVKTWTGLASFSGEDIWSDGTNIYYSSGHLSQYVLNGNTWVATSWKGLPHEKHLYGKLLWTDGLNIYYTNPVRYGSSGDFAGAEPFHTILLPSTAKIYAMLGEATWGGEGQWVEVGSVS